MSTRAAKRPRTRSVTASQLDEEHSSTAEETPSSRSSSASSQITMDLTEELSPDPLEDLSCCFEFYAYMRSAAAKYDRDHAFTQGHHPRLQSLDKDISFYQAGRHGYMPEAWAGMYDEFTKLKSNRKLAQFYALQEDLKKEIAESEKKAGEWVKGYNEKPLARSSKAPPRAGEEAPLKLRTHQRNNKD